MKVADFGAGEAAAVERRAVWAQARRILAVRLDNLGDVLLTSPAIRALKAGARDRRVTLLASPAGAQVARHVPELDTALVYDAPWMPAHNARPGSNGADRSADMRMIGTLRGLGFDAAVIFTAYSQSALPAALLCTLAGIALRLAHCRENPYGLLTDWRADPEPHALLRHEVRRQLDLVAQVGCTTADERLSFHVQPRERAAGLQRLERAGIDPRQRFVVVHAGASAASRRYPHEHFVSALTALASNEPALQFVLTGSSAEAELAEWIRARVAAARAVSLAGTLSLAELGAVLEAAALLISNDAGPVHIAAAMGTPVVDIDALTTGARSVAPAIAELR